MKNRKLSERIKDLKQQLDQVTQDITDVHYENVNEQIFNISLEKKEFLEKVNSEISKSLDILDEDNEKLFSKVSYLKNEVEKAIENFDKESHFLDLFKKFINSDGNSNLLLKDFENKMSDKISSSKDEILVSTDSNSKLEKLSEQLEKLELLNKSALKHLNSSDSLENEKNTNEISESNMENFISLNLFSEIHSVFEIEIKKINSINSNKQSFLSELFGNKFLTKEQKIEKISGKITALNNEFNKKINSLFTSTNVGGTKKETKVIKESYKNTINNSYLDLQNELINELDKEIIAKVNTNQSDSIIENGINYIDTSNLEELKKAINEVENKINLQKVKYSSSESSKESLDYYLYLNHVDKVSVENEISKNYFSICEEFIKKLELKKEVLQKLVDNFIVYVDDNCNQMIVHISEKLEKAQKVILTDDDSLSNNNFFAQKSIELFENLKTNSNEIFNLLNEKFKNILKDVSLESLKTSAISFEYLSTLIKDSIKEINAKVFRLTDLSNRELAKIAELSENGLYDLKSEIINEANQIYSYLSNSYLELEEISKDVEKNIRDYLKFKLNKLEQVNSYVSNYQESNQKNDFEGFENSSNYVGVRLERLERQYSKIVNLLNPIAEKLSAATNVENLENIESRINSKIDQLISNIESNRSDDESKYSAAVNEILLSNEVHKQNILNLIQSIEEEKLNIISEESKRAVIENGKKLSELEQLIDVQNQEIEALLTEKNSFIEEIEDILINKKHKLNDEKIENIKSAIQEVIYNFNERIDDFEYNFDRKLSTIDLNSLNLATQKDQKELFEEIEKKLSNNYEVIKEEVKQDLFQVLNSINELNSKVINNRNESYDDRFNEINNQFDQFRFLLKEVTDNVIDKNNKQYEEVNSIIESLNNKFVNLIEDLRDENIKSGQIIISKVSENTGKFKEEFDSSLEEISNQLSNLANDIENKNKEFETAHVDAINFILETNRNNQREILGYIKNIEDNNERFLNEIEAKKYNIENSKLKNLEELIELQNNEIESLISEKNSFVIEVEKYISNKKDQLTNENILKLENSIQDVVGVLNAKIEDLEIEFGRKLQELDLSSYFDYFDKTHNDFINSVQLQLSNNYEVIKNEIKNDIESVLDSVKDIPLRMDYSHKFDDRFNEIDSQFEQFRFILKNTTESILDKDSKTYKEVNDVINTLSNKFESLISDLKDENIKTVDLLNEKIATSQEEVNRKIDSSVDLIDDKFELFLKEIKEQNKYFETTQFDTIQSIIETNKVNQKEILGYIRNLEQTNAEFLNEIEARRISKENLKLKELEELISLQNQEIEELLDEKEEFINEVETFMLNKKNKLDSENLIRLEDSIKITMANFSDKITDLERSFDKKIADIDLSSVSSLVSSEQANFFDSIQDSLTYNYELVRNEFKDNLNEVLNTITALSESSENKLGQIDNQLENFRSLLKDVTEGFLNKEEKHYLQIDDILSNLNEEFNKVIKSIEIQNKKTGNYISNNIKNNNRKLLKKIDSSLSEMNENFNNLVDDVKTVSKIIENNHVDTIETILELNQNSKKEIFEFINLLENSNQKLVNEVLQIQNKKDSLKLQELEELIDIQNQELEALIDDKNDFINEIENFVRSNKSSLNENNVSKLESSIENLINTFYRKIDEFETNFNNKFVSLDLSSLNNSLQDSQSQSLKEIKEQLVSNYEVIKNILKSELDKIIEDIQNHNMVEEQNFEKINSKFNEFKNALQNLSLNDDYSSFDTINNLANSLNTEFDDLVVGLKADKNDLDLQEKIKNNSALPNKKFDLFISELDEKIKSLEKNELVDEFKKWWTDFKNSATLFTQGDSINLVLESNKINQIEINEYIKKLEKQNSYLENELKKEQEKFSILKIKEIEELIDAQNSEISLLLNDWERLIFELERYLQNVLNITAEKYDEYSLEKITDLNSSLGDVINRFKLKVDNLENSFKNKISNINEDINPVDNKEILKIEKNLFDNYSFLRNDLENIFKSILFKIDEIKNSKNKEVLKSKVNELINDIENIKNANETSVKKLNDKNLLLEKIENFVTEKFENKKSMNETFESFYANSDSELSEKLNKLENWYSNLINHIESNNKDIISAYVDNKINEIKIENNVTSDDLLSTYKSVISKLSQISNLLNLSKNNISKIFDDLFKKYNNKSELLNLLAEFNKVVWSSNKIINNLSYQNDKYLESIHLANKKNTLFEIGKELVSVLDLLSKNQSLLNADFANFELELKALNEILLNPFNLDVVTNFIVRITDLLKNNTDLLTRLFFNFESKKDANLIKLHAIQDSLRMAHQELNKLNDDEINKQNYVIFNEKLDEIKNTLLISHLDLKVFKESEIEKTLLSSTTNSDVLKIEFKKIVLLEDLIKYYKDYLKNILNQKNRLVNFLIKENQSDEANCLVEFRASQIYNNLSAKVTEDQIKGINEITSEFEKNIDNLENKTNLISAKNLKNKSLLYEKISELELEIARLFDIVEKKKNAFIEILSEALLNQSDSEVKKIISRFENSKEMIQNEYFQELEVFKKQIFSLREKELEDFKKEISIIESEINTFKNSDISLIPQKEKELEPLDNLIEELHFEISSFEQEKENHYKEVAEKLAYLNSLGSSKEKSFEDTVNTDKFKINLNNDVKEIIENEFMSFKQTFTKNLEQIKNGFNLIKSSYSNNNDEIDNPSWFTSFDEKVKNIETDIISEKINSEKNVNKNTNNNIKLEINGEKVKGFIVETESKKREIEDFYKKVNDLIELRKTKKNNS